MDLLVQDWFRLILQLVKNARLELVWTILNVFLKQALSRWVLHRAYKNGRKAVKKKKKKKKKIKKNTPGFLEDYAQVSELVLMGWASGNSECWTFARTPLIFCLEILRIISDGFFFSDNPKAENSIATKRSFSTCEFQLQRLYARKSSNRFRLFTYENKYQEYRLQKCWRNERTDLKTLVPLQLAKFYF